MPERINTARLESIHGSSSLLICAPDEYLVPSPNARKLTIRTVPSRTASARRWKVSMTGNAQTVSRTVVPTQVLPHHSKKGRKDSLSIGECPSHGDYADPDHKRTSAGHFGAPVCRGGLIPGAYVAEDRLVKNQCV